MFWAEHRALALNGQRTLDQYVHTSWGADKGFIGGNVSSIARSSDGYLWMGTERGLVRFDGYEFTLLETTAATGDGPLGPVRGLQEDGDGNLWVRLNGQLVLKYHDGVFENASQRYNLFDEAFTAMAADASNHVLLWGSRLRTIGFRDNRFAKSFPADQINGIVTSLAETSPGMLWLATRDAGLFRFEAGHYSHVLSEADLLSINALAPSEQGGVWIGTEKGLYLYEGDERVRLHLPEELDRAQILALVRDQHHNLWVGTDIGLFRVDPRLRKVTGVLRSLEAPRVSALYEDGEGSLWFANARGLDRLRDGMFTSILSGDKSKEEFGGGPVFVDETGATWFAPVSGGLFHLVNGTVQRMEFPGLHDDIVYSIAGHGEEVWLGRQQGGLTRLKRRDGGWDAQTFTQKDGVAQNSVYTVTRASDGSVWAGTVSAGISVFRSGRFKTYNVNTGLPSNAVFASLETADHRMWFATPSGLVCFDGERRTIYGVSDGGGFPETRNLFEDSGHVLWVGTSRGLARFDRGLIAMPRNLPQALNEEVLSIGEDVRGFLWVVTAEHILQINRAKLMSGALEERDILSYGLDDGLVETQGVRRDRSLVADALGHVWLSLAHSFAVADVNAADNYRRPDRARIDGIFLDSAGEKPWNHLDLASGTRSITFRYSGMNMAMPQRTHFRYRLGELEQTWSGDTALRQVVYNNLSPGRYTFRIMASDALGAWSGEETEVSFRILPKVWQTWYFELLCGVLSIVLVIVFYRVRMMQVTNHLNQRFQDRLAERTRIAQDLHDTLLQGVISASLQLDVAQDHIPKDSAAAPMLARVLQLMRYVTDEGREALRGLRTIDSSVSMETALQRMRDELEGMEDAKMQLYVQGSAKMLKPAVFDEVYRIAREAYTNALRHASPGRIEMSVEYGARIFRLRVRDDGCGIDPVVLKTGRDGHWGLPGMRERAKSICSPLSIRSRRPGGTDVDLRVPSVIAYMSRRSRRKRWLW